jgi:hypothetical protein
MLTQHPNGRALWSTKVSAAADGLGNPARLLFGPGQRRDATRNHE